MAGCNHGTTGECSVPQAATDNRQYSHCCPQEPPVSLVAQDGDVGTSMPAVDVRLERVFLRLGAVHAVCVCVCVGARSAVGLKRAGVLLRPHQLPSSPTGTTTQPIHPTPAHAGNWTGSTGCIHMQNVQDWDFSCAAHRPRKGPSSSVPLAELCFPIGR